jgi:hypothetical protein
MTDNTTGVVRLEVEVAPETAAEIRKLIAARGWDFTEGLRILFGAGIGALKASALKDQDLHESESDRMLRHAAENEQAVALLRYRLYETQKANEAWDLSTGAIHNQNAGFRAIIDRQIGELTGLKRQLYDSEFEVQQLRAKLGDQETANAADLEPQAETPRWKSLLMGLFRRLR